MIEIDVPQGSLEWQDLRNGIPTASGFPRITTPGGKPSAQAEEYMAELVGEYFSGESVSEWGGNIWTERGQVLEPEARRYYAFAYDAEPRLAGFVYRDDQRMVGASPDWFIDGIPGEIKCPMLGRHLLYLSRGVVPRQYIPQLQGQMWVTGAARAVFMSYYPDFPPLVVHAERDEKYHAALDEHIPKFIDELLAARERLREMGVEQWRPEAA